MAEGGGPDTGWDFFISYTQADRAWAEWIAWTLEDDGHRVLMQAWDFVPGSNWTKSMQNGVVRATRTIAVLSEAYLQSVFGAAEWQAAWAADPGGEERKLLPVRVTDCDRPGLLASVVGIDVFGRKKANAKEALLKAVAHAQAGRAKPVAAPPFPGESRAIPEPARFPGLPSSWKVTGRNPNFTGRDLELAEISLALTAGSAVTAYSLRGMGGVGKSQLAIEYAHIYAGDYDLAWSIAAEKPAAIPDQFAELARNLGLNPADDLDELRDQVHHALRDLEGWLLIFDNADDAADIRPWLPAIPLRAGVPGHVIITTRRGGFRSLGQVMELDVIDLPAAVRLFRARVPDLEQSAAEEIAAVLGRLPLGLEQAAAYIDITQTPPGDYLHLLKAHTTDMLSEGQAFAHSDTIATVWTLSFDRIQADNPASLQLLEMCAYLAPDSIPLDLFKDHPGQLPAPLAYAVVQLKAFNEAVGTLIDFALAKRTNGGLQLHRLVQAALRARHEQPSRSLPDQSDVP
jgi:hypothetical protein